MFAVSVSAQADVVFLSGNALLQQCEPKPNSLCVGAAAGYSDMLSLNGQICAATFGNGVPSGMRLELAWRVLRVT